MGVGKLNGQTLFYSMPNASLSMVRKIVSGGQTGVDRAALDVALFLNIEHGGWCPAGRRAEDGPIPTCYQLRTTESRDYAVRTEQNVIDSDGTLILYRQRMTGGTDLTRKMAEKHRRPCFAINLEEVEPTVFQDLNNWLLEFNVAVLNIAGPRESSCPGITKEAEKFLLNSFKL